MQAHVMYAVALPVIVGLARKSMGKKKTTSGEHLALSKGFQTILQHFGDIHLFSWTRWGFQRHLRVWPQTKSDNILLFLFILSLEEGAEHVVSVPWLVWTVTFLFLYRAVSMWHLTMSLGLVYHIFQCCFGCLRDFSMWGAYVLCEHGCHRQKGVLPSSRC